MRKRALSVSLGPLFLPLLAVLALLPGLAFAQPASADAWAPSTAPGPEAEREVERMKRLQRQVQRLHFRVQRETNTAQRVKLQRQLIAGRARFRQARQRAVFLTDPFVRRSQEMARELLRRSFPELPQERFRFHSIESETTFFTSFFSFSEPLLKRNRTYLIGINPQLFRRSTLPPLQGVRAILCHELAHSLDYQRRSFFGLWGVLAIFLNGESNRRFERWADLQAISKGCGPGLIAYREWIYQQVPPGERERRQRLYFPPGQIRAVEEVRAACPSAMDRWLEKPPLNPSAIEAADCRP